MALMMTSVLCLTAFAADDPAVDAIGGIINEIGDEPTEGVDHNGGSKNAADGEAPSEQRRSRGISEETATDPAPSQAPATEPQTQSATLRVKQSVQDEAPSMNRTAIIIVIICGGALLILLILIVALLLRRRSSADTETSARSSASRGAQIRIEVLSGLCYNAALDFHLRRNLTIGADRGCDLVFDDPDMQPMHAVISRNGGIVTLAECSDTQNTYVGGMKIFAPNRLRSGDIVTIGSTSFQIFF